jgi:SSS family solute:Na+ symporter
MPTTISLLDIFIILIYFGIILWIAQWASKSKSESGGAVDYFLAGKNSGWLVIGASLFASNIGSVIGFSFFNLGSSLDFSTVYDLRNFI